MIISLLYYVAAVLINSISSVLNFLFPFSLPSTFYSAFGSALNTFQYFSGLIDLPVMFNVLYYLISFEIIWLTFLIVWYVVGFFRSLVSVGGASGHGNS